MQTGTVTAVTVSPDGTQFTNGFITFWQLSASGQFVVFESNATNLVSGFKAIARRSFTFAIWRPV